MRNISKKTMPVFLLPVILIYLFIIPVAAYTTNVSSTGLPYNDYDSSVYFDNDHLISDKGTKSSLEFSIDDNFELDKEGLKYVSSDTLTVNIEGIPLSETIVKEGQFYLANSLKIDVNVYTKFELTKGQEVDEIWNTLVEDGIYVDGSSSQTTMWGRPALESLNEYPENITYHATYYIYLNDLKLTNAVTVVTIFIITGMDYTQSEAFDLAEYEAEERAFREKYSHMAQLEFEKLKNALSGVTITFDKVRNNYGDTNKPKWLSAFGTKASETAGTTSVPVAAAIVIGSAVTSIIGAGAAVIGKKSPLSDNGTDEKKSGSTYKMVLYKEFGDKIKYNGDTVYVYAKMVEVTPEGSETERPDLTQRISISSENPLLLETSHCVMTGEYMACGVIAGKSADENVDSESVISFRFIGDGGVFQNNVIFKVVGKAYVALDREKLFVLAFSGRSFEMPYELVNFVKKADEITVKSMQGGDGLFDLTLGVNSDKKTVIICIDKSAKKPVETFLDSFACEIIAKNDTEYARTVFSIVLCYEGLFISYGLSRETGLAEVSAAAKTDGTFEDTELDLYLLKWNEEQNYLDANPSFLSANLVIHKVEFEDSESEKVFSVSEFAIKYDRERTLNLSTAVYKLSVNKNIPGSSADNFKGIIPLSLEMEDETYELSVPVKIKPAYMPGTGKWDEEYQYCKDIINKYMPEELREAKLHILETNKLAMGWEDIYKYRHECWTIARNFIIQEGEDYLAKAKEWDELLGKAEMVKWVADKSFSVVASAAFGPFGSFICVQVYDTMCDVITISINKWDQDWYTLGSEIIWKRVGGFSDKTIEKYAFSDPKMAMKWIAQYAAYKLLWHWYWDYEGANRKGFIAAIKSTGLDLAGVALKQGLKKYLGEAVTKGYISGEKNYYFDEKIIKAGGDKAVQALSQAADKSLDYVSLCVNKIVETLANLEINITF